MAKNIMIQGTMSNAGKSLLVAERDRLKKRIEQMQQTLKRLNYKISVYDERIVACEKKLLK